MTLYTQFIGCAAYLPCVILFRAYDQTLFIDSSSTCLQLVEHVKQFEGLTIITNGLVTAHLLSENTSSDVYCVGGKIVSKRATINGPDANNHISQFFADIAFISCRGFDLLNGATEVTEGEALIKDAYQKYAKKVILLVDSSKMGKAYTRTSLNFDQIDVIVSDSKLPKEIDLKAKKYNIKILVNKSDSH